MFNENLKVAVNVEFNLDKFVSTVIGYKYDRGSNLHDLYGC